MSKFCTMQHLFMGEVMRGTQRSVAVIYAMYLGQNDPNTPWAEMNTAIMSRWPKGLARVKELAHRIGEEACCDAE